MKKSERLFDFEMQLVFAILKLNKRCKLNSFSVFRPVILPLALYHLQWLEGPY